MKALGNEGTERSSHTGSHVTRPEKNIDNNNNLKSGNFAASAYQALHGLDPYLYQSLFHPVAELKARPSKKFRKRLVATAYQMVSRDEVMAKEKSDQIESLGELLEALHLGSLVVDDIQDGSHDRRGGPALHITMGMPQALCAGNWLYFKALRDLQSLGLNQADELLATRAFGETMELAHYGQMLDLSVKASRLPLTELPQICEKICRLKTGCLTAFAVFLGALLAGGTRRHFELISEFGHEFGLILQMCDDLGNVLCQKDQAKHLEDLWQDKPSSLWTLAAKLSTRGGDSLLESLRMHTTPETFTPLALSRWLADTQFHKHAQNHLLTEIDRAFLPLEASRIFVSDAVAHCKSITKELLNAYA